MPPWSAAAEFGSGWIQNGSRGWRQRAFPSAPPQNAHLEAVTDRFGTRGPRPPVSSKQGSVRTGAGWRVRRPNPCQHKVLVARGWLERSAAPNPCGHKGSGGALVVRGARRPRPKPGARAELLQARAIVRQPAPAGSCGSWCFRGSAVGTVLGSGDNRRSNQATAGVAQRFPRRRHGGASPAEPNRAPEPARLTGTHWSFVHDPPHR